MALVVAAGAPAISASPPQNTIYEYDITGDLAIASGEPQIAIDPANPAHMAVIEFARGSKQFPAYQLGIGASEIARDRASPYGGTDGDISLSADGGDTWTKLPRPNPAATPPITTTPTVRKGGGDPYIAYGPGGVIYVGEEVATNRDRPGYPFDAPDDDPTVAASADFGRTWTPPTEFHTPVDRPWITVDQSTGKLYSVSSGYLNFTDHTHNIPGPNAVLDRWLVVYQPMLKGQTTPRRLGGPDFAATNGNTIAANHGVIAATFVLGQKSWEDAHQAEHSPIIPVPASLRAVTPASVSECSPDKLCLFFEISKDEGLTWSRHNVPVPGGFSAGYWVNMAADAGRAGRYAIAVLNPAQTALLVVVTDDYGATWSAPAEIPQIAAGVVFKQWIAYGPTGVLGVVWKNRRDDIPVPQVPPIVSGDDRDTIQPAFDVYNAISCDGGLHWQTPVRLNAVTSPPGFTRSDDLSYIALDSHASHMVWADRRVLPQVHNVPGAVGGTHSFYGRVPFSVVTHGAACGRD
jgi:hypothetical protein